MDRNDWLKASVKPLRALFRTHGILLPRRIHISVGFPSYGSKGNVIAECWNAESSSDGSAQIFISPTLNDRIEVLSVLTHELVHSSLDNEGGHKHQFQKVARMVGLVSPWIEANPGPTLSKQLLQIGNSLGKYNNPVFSGLEEELGSKGSRLLKVSCADCDYIARMTRKQINRGLPRCGVCSKEMAVDEPKV